MPPPPFSHNDATPNPQPNCPATTSRALSPPPAQRLHRGAIRQSGPERRALEAGARVRSVDTAGRQGEAWSRSFGSAMEAARKPAVRRRPLPLASPAAPVSSQRTKWAHVWRPLANEAPREPGARRRGSLFPLPV